jgi:catechol 2,3-dioxygenase-like lactoylglutathione lyase family enzyme/predicted enzyme related to lactoylglutathione lyase
MTHASKHIHSLRSVALHVPDLALAEKFYTETWHLTVSAREPGAIYLRGTGRDQHILSLHQKTGQAQIRNVTLRVRQLESLEAVASAALQAGGKVVKPRAALLEPGGGQALSIADPVGRIFRLVFGDELVAPISGLNTSSTTDGMKANIKTKDQPSRLAHVVLNSDNVAASQKFLEEALDFSLADRTRIMAFMRCNDDHHSIAFGDTDNNALNHIAFVMPDLDSVMRGGGRLKDAGFPIEWGPGRHGPGNNTFNYFIGPFGEVIEYTADVQQVDDSYQAGTPAEWAWGPGRTDHWGISQPPSAALKAAQRMVHFANE